MTDRELYLAYQVWKKSYENANCDSFIEPFLSEKIFSTVPNQSWIRTVRKALFLSMESAAKKLNISRPAFAQIERREAQGSVTLKTLSQVAESLDCELVYAFRPKEKTPLSLRIWLSLIDESMNISKKRKYSVYNQGLSLAATARELMNQSQFRKNHSWTERK